MTQQHGGTLLGFIIGVVVGMGAALTVAVYVTKVPVPFVSKGKGHSAEQEAAEARKNKDWDPNAPLYGKNPVKPVAPASVPVTPMTVPSAPEPVVAKSAASKPIGAPAAVAGKADAKPLVGADPLGDLAKAKTSGTPSEPFAFFVQVGAFRTAEDAEAQRAKLLLSGVDAKVTEREQSGRTVFRVRVGPFDRKDEAERAKDKLEAAGLETALVRVQR
ncbi:MAG: SPOR domain-containing protein [Rhodoferax sp.]|nr:SPOR domain-containing protein [Rhodoferax sp.]